MDPTRAKEDRSLDLVPCFLTDYGIAPGVLTPQAAALKERLVLQVCIVRHVPLAAAAAD